MCLYAYWDCGGVLWFPLVVQCVMTAAWGESTPILLAWHCLNSKHHCLAMSAGITGLWGRWSQWKVVLFVQHVISPYHNQLTCSLAMLLNLFFPLRAAYVSSVITSSVNRADWIKITKGQMALVVVLWLEEVQSNILKTWDIISEWCVCVCPFQWGH